MIQAKVSAWDGRFVPDETANRDYSQSRANTSECPLTCLRTGPRMATQVPPAIGREPAGRTPNDAGRSLEPGFFALGAVTICERKHFTGQVQLVNAAEAWLRA